METTILTKRKISIKTEDYLRTLSLLKELSIKILDNFSTTERRYLMIEAEESVIERLKENFQKETSHPLIII